MEYTPRTAKEPTVVCNSAEGAELGISTAKCASGGIPTRWEAQDHVAQLWPGSRASNCCRTMTSSTVEVDYQPVTESATFAGVQTCGSVWACPVCASKISEKRRIELRQGLDYWLAQGNSVMMLTFTVRHNKGDSLRDLVDGIKKARKRMRSGRKAQAWSRRYGFAGSVRALEVTHGANGWHPHVHEIYFFEGDLPEEVLRLAADELRTAWSEAVAGVGLRDVNEHGTRYSAADLTAADYVAKFGHERSWGADSELCKAVRKSGRGKGRTPSQLLADSLEGDARAGFLWVEYACIMRGDRQLFWSKGLRSLLNLGVEKSDEELANEREQHAVEVLTLSRPEWQFICRQGLRGELLELVRSRAGDETALLAWLTLRVVFPLLQKVANGEGGIQTSTA